MRLDKRPLQGEIASGHHQPFIGGSFFKEGIILPEAASCSGSGLTWDGDCLGQKPGSVSYQWRGWRLAT